MIEFVNFDKVEEEQAAKQEQEKAVAVSDMSDKSIADVSLKDVKFRLDSNQTYEQQAKDVVNAMATAKAVEDEATVQALAKGKQDELIGEQQSKVKKTQKDFIDAQTEEQKANIVLCRNKQMTVELHDFVQTRLKEWQEELCQ